MRNFNEVYKQHKTRMENYVSFKVSDSYAVEEIVSDLFIRVSKYLPIYDESKSSLSTWMINIANSSISDYFRKENKHKNTLHVTSFVDEKGNEFLPLYSDNDASTLVERRELQSSINIALDNLTPKHKQIIDLYYLQEMKYTEIAEILDIPLNSVKVTILRAKNKLRLELASTWAEY